MTGNKQDLSFACFGEVKDEKYQMVLLPWGATEPHNYHLPYLTDCILTHSLAVEAAKKAYEKYGIKSMVMPPVMMGAQNIGQWNQQFCIHYDYTTQKAILHDMVRCLYLQGFRRLIIVNGHGGNTFKSMIRDFALEWPDFVIAVAEWFNHLPSGIFENPGSHADETETSLMLHYHPELVRMEMAGDGNEKKFSASTLNDHTAWTPRNWQKVSEDTGVGNPKIATAEKGMKAAEVLTDQYAKLIKEFSEENLY